MKYYLIKTKENCDIGNCGGTKNVLDIYSTNFVELTEKEIELIKSRLQPDFTGFEWDVENKYWQECSNLQEKIGRILDNEKD